MEDLVIQTSKGPVSVVGRVHAHGARPCLLAVGGAFPPKDQLHHFVSLFANANVLVGRLPGMYAGLLEDERAETWSAAFDEVIALIFRDLPVVAYGASTGCLATLGLKSPTVCRHVAVEPFLSTAHLWPFVPNARERLALNENNPLMARFLKNVFGIAPDTLEDRDYAPLFARLDKPTDVIVGALPLEDPNVEVWPSFTTTEDRQRLTTNPHVRLHQAPPGSGHNVEGTEAGQRLVNDTVRAALREIIPKAPV